RAGRYDSTWSGAFPPDAHPLRGPDRVAIRPTPGRSLVTGRALHDIIRTATLGSYGVTGFAGGPLSRLLGQLGLRQPGLDVRADDGIEIELDLMVAMGVPVAEVARQVDSAIRYAIRRALDREITRLLIHVDGLRVHPGGAVPQVSTERPTAIRSRDLADSGTDVA
ncbi:MAG: Asp23/Gls24 family envelope stress response protein, partial [Candidatus Limnocylindrales bacterium]